MMLGIGNFLTQSGGIILAVIGAVLAVSMSGWASAKGCSMVGKATAGIIAEEPEKFGKALILQLLPGTNGLYGFIVGFLILLRLAEGPTLAQGFYLFVASAPMWIIGYLSAIFQAQVSTASLQILVKNPEHSTKGIIFTAIIETYAILGFVASIIMLFVTYS